LKECGRRSGNINRLVVACSHTLPGGFTSGEGINVCQPTFIIVIVSIVAFGGFLMGLDASAFSSVVGFSEPAFAPSKIQVVWAVSCLTLTAALKIFCVAQSKVNALPVSLAKCAGIQRSSSRTQLTLG